MPQQEIEESLTYTNDWTKYLSRHGADTISSSTWAEDSGNITIVSSSNSTTQATVRLSGGTHGSIYTIENLIVTAAGDSVKESIDVPVVEHSSKNINPYYY